MQRKWDEKMISKGETEDNQCFDKENIKKARKAQHGGSVQEDECAGDGTNINRDDAYNSSLRNQSLLTAREPSSLLKKKNSVCSWVYVLMDYETPQLYTLEEFCKDKNDDSLGSTIAHTQGSSYMYDSLAKPRRYGKLPDYMPHFPAKETTVPFLLFDMNEFPFTHSDIWYSGLLRRLYGTPNALQQECHDNAFLCLCRRRLQAYLLRKFVYECNGRHPTNYTTTENVQEDPVVGDGGLKGLFPGSLEPHQIKVWKDVFYYAFSKNVVVIPWTPHVAMKALQMYHPVRWLGEEALKRSLKNWRIRIRNNENDTEEHHRKRDRIEVDKEAPYSMYQSRRKTNGDHCVFEEINPMVSYLIAMCQSVWTLGKKFAAREPFFSRTPIYPPPLPRSLGPVDLFHQVDSFERTQSWLDQEGISREGCKSLCGQFIGTFSVDNSSDLAILQDFRFTSELQSFRNKDVLLEICRYHYQQHQMGAQESVNSCTHKMEEETFRFHYNALLANNTLAVIRLHLQEFDKISLGIHNIGFPGTSFSSFFVLSLPFPENYMSTHTGIMGYLIPQMQCLRLWAIPLSNL
jgi:hypothetical protein